MPASAVSTFTEPDAYHEAIQNAEVEGVVTARGTYRTELTRIRLHRLWMQRGAESLPRVMNCKVDGTRPGILFATDQNQPAHHVGGVELPPGEIMIGSGSDYHHRSSAACRWGAMSLPVDDLAIAGRAIIGRDLAVPSLTRVRPPPALLARLLSLHEAAVQLAKNAPDILAKGEVARAIEQALMDAMVRCLSEREAADTHSVHQHHAKAMRRLETFLEENSDGNLYAAELCAAAAVSDRTLRALCQEHLGMSPIRYLWLRRMHLARRTLRTADAATTTVTEIATDYGFWELGRFAVTYRSLFGEAPSATLRRPPEDPRPQKITGSPWQLPESA